MLRVVALLLAALLGRFSVVQHDVRPLAPGGSSWATTSSSPAVPASRVIPPQLGGDALVHRAGAPTAPGNDAGPRWDAGAALHERELAAALLRLRLARSTPAIAAGARARLAFPYDATAPPARA